MISNNFSDCDMNRILVSDADAKRLRITFLKDFRMDLELHVPERVMRFWFSCALAEREERVGRKKNNDLNDDELLQCELEKLINCSRRDCHTRPLTRTTRVVMSSGLHAEDREYKILAIRLLRDGRKRPPRRCASRWYLIQKMDVF